MDTTFKLILDKLTTIESRLGELEGGNTQAPQAAPAKVRDPLFAKALALAQSHEELPSSLLQKELSIDQKKADLLLGQLEEAGFGTCYMGEA